MSGTQRLPGGERRKASQRHSRRAAKIMVLPVYARTITRTIMLRLSLIPMDTTLKLSAMRHADNAVSSHTAAFASKPPLGYVAKPGQELRCAQLAKKTICRCKMEPMMSEREFRF